MTPAAVFICCSLHLFTPRRLASQPIWGSEGFDRQVALEIVKPFLDVEDISFSTAAYIISLRIPVTKRSYFEGDIPLSHVGFNDVDRSVTGVGNLRLGMGFRSRDTSWGGGFGLRLPTGVTNDLAVTAGGLGDFIDRLEAFRSTTLSLDGNVGYNFRKNRNFHVRLQGGPIVHVFFTTTEWNEPDAYLSTFFHYVAQGVYLHRNFEFGGGISGRYQMNYVEKFDEGRWMNQLGLMGSVRFKKGQLGLSLRAPLAGDIADYAPVTLGVNAALNLD